VHEAYPLVTGVFSNVVSVVSHVLDCAPTGVAPGD